MSGDARTIYVIAAREFRSITLSWRILLFGGILMLAIAGFAWGVVTLANNDASFPGTDIVVEDPGEMLAVTSTGFVYLGSLLAVALGFDAITTEKVRGTIDLLLVRPGRPWSVAMGKYLGLMGAMSIPLVAACLLAIVLIGQFGSGYPPIGASLAFIGFSILFMSIFLLIELTLSTWIDSVGLATLAGISVWVLFVFFWLLIPASLAFILGMPIQGEAGLGSYSVEFSDFLDRFTILNPILSYSNTMEVFTGSDFVRGIPRWLPPVALVVWNSILLLVYPLMFTRRFRG